MSLARRLLASSSSGVYSLAPAAQVEYVIAGTYGLIVPPDVYSFSAVAIAAGGSSPNTTPFNGTRAGNLHWRNSVPCTPGELLLVTVGDGAGVLVSPKESSIKRGSTFLLRAANDVNLYNPTLGGGGGLGGNGGPGQPGGGGLGGGGPGYVGRGGAGGNYPDTIKGQFPDTDSGGGRGGSTSGAPTGWVSLSGEGTGLLGRTPDMQGSLGALRFGNGVWGGPGAVAPSGAVRLVWGGVAARTYPDNAPDVASSTPATYVSSAQGSGSAFTFHASAQPGDLVIAWRQVGSGGGSDGGVVGSSNWNRLPGASPTYWKQVTAADIAASGAGTISFGGSGTVWWITATYRGPRMCMLRTQANDNPPATTVVVPGFTKRIDCRRVVTLASDLDLAATMVTPAGFTSRQARIGTAPVARLSDIAPASYVNGASVTYTGMVATSSATAQLLELY